MKIFMTALSAPADINIKDGAYFKKWIDFEIPSERGTLSWSRTYRSRSHQIGLFGFGWCTDFDARIIFVKSTEIQFDDCRYDQKLSLFQDRDGLFSSRSPAAILKKVKEHYQLKWQDEERLFDEKGRLLQISFPRGLTVRLQYKGNDLVKLQTNIKDNLELIILSKDGLVTSVEAPRMGAILFSYRDGNLIQFQKASIKEDYTYDSFHNLLRVERNGKLKETLRYDESMDRVLTHQAEGCVDQYQYQDPQPLRLKVERRSQCLNQRALLESYYFFYSEQGSAQSLIRLELRRAADRLIYKFDRISGKLLSTQRLSGRIADMN